MDSPTMPDPLDAAEFEDALGVLDELHMVMSRLKRLRLVNDQEHYEARLIIEQMTGLLTRKISG
jgi:hypothetical protein